MPAQEARVGWLEEHTGAAMAEVTDRSPWDWYALSCPCGLPPGECRASPRPAEPAAPAGRLAGLTGVRLAVGHPVAAPPGFGRARDPRTAAGKRRPLDPPAVLAARGRLPDRSLMFTNQPQAAPDISLPRCAPPPAGNSD